jgi:hypothetical protein
MTKPACPLPSWQTQGTGFFSCFVITLSITLDSVSTSSGGLPQSR